MTIKLLLQKTYIITLIGFISFITIFCLKFLRIRLPKDLPLLLSDKLFISLCLVCITLFISLLYSINIFFNIYHIKQNKLIIEIQTYIKDSLYQLDYLIKTLIKKYFNIKLELYYIMLLNYLKKHIVKSKIFFLFFMLPKLLLPLILFIEVFFIGHIYYFYKTILFMLLPLFYNYLFYCLHWFYILELESVERVLILHEIIEDDHNIIIEKFKPHGFHFYIQEHTLDRLGLCKNKHEFNVELNPDFIKNNLRNYTEEKRNDFYSNYCSKALPFCSKLYEILYIYTMHTRNISLYINIYMLFIYFICWLYVLFTANYAYISFDFLLNSNKFLYYEEPFSGLFIHDNN